MIALPNLRKAFFGFILLPSATAELHERRQQKQADANNCEPGYKFDDRPDAEVPDDAGEEREAAQVAEHGAEVGAGLRGEGHLGLSHCFIGAINSTAFQNALVASLTGQSVKVTSPVCILIEMFPLPHEITKEVGPIGAYI